MCWSCWQGTCGGVNILLIKPGLARGGFHAAEDYLAAMQGAFAHIRNTSGGLRKLSTSQTLAPCYGREHGRNDHVSEKSARDDTKINCHVIHTRR